MELLGKNKVPIGFEGAHKRCRLDSNQRIRVLQTRPLPLGYGTKVHYDDIILRLTFQEKDKRGKNQITIA